MSVCKICHSKASYVINTIKGVWPQESVAYAFRCQEHLAEKVAAMRLSGGKGTFGAICIPCGGTGKQPRFNHVQGGVCFRCSGTGIMGTKEEI
jgi:hypothetical protein